MDQNQYDNVLWALAVYREARGEPYAAKQAVARVILNRIHDPRWPNTPAGVVLQHAQFSSFLRGDPNAGILPARDDKTWLECCQAVNDAETTHDATGGATHYHSYQGGDPHWPKWATPIQETARLGAFKFYKL